MALCFAAASSQYAEIPSVYTDLIASRTDMTFSIWFRTTNGGSQPFLWSTKGAGVAKSFLELAFLTGFYFGTNSGGNFITSDGRLTRADEWTHLSVTRSSVTGLGSVWVNGVNYYSATLPAHAAGSGDLYLGRYDSGFYLGGKLYDFHLHQAVLTKSQIRTIWSGGSVTQNCVGWWKMDEASGTTIADSVSTRDGTTYGATFDSDVPTYGELDASGTARTSLVFSQQVIG